MSSYLKKLKNPKTGKMQIAFCLDNYFGRRKYGFGFRKDGGDYDGEEIVPIEEFCKKCGQVIRINGAKQDIVIPNKNNE